MPTAQNSVDIDVPISTVYNQWTQFEDFPAFMSGVESIRQVDDRHLEWRIKVAGVSRDFTAEITEQHPEERVAWRSVSGPSHAGVVTFHKISPETTRVTYQLELDADGLVEAVGERTGIVGKIVESDVKNFKGFIEKRSHETGAWRGDVPRDE